MFKTIKNAWSIPDLRKKILFIAYISAMLRCKIIDGTYEKTADRIDLVFRTGREISTICNHLSEADDVYFDICEAVRETKKKYKKN